MSEKQKNNEIQGIVEENNVSKSKKHKYNSKRRKPKKNFKAPELISDSENSEIDLNKLMLDVISDNELDALESNQIQYLKEELAGPRANSTKMYTNNFKHNNKVSESPSMLSALFKNLQIKSSSNIKEMLKLDLLKKGKIEFSLTEDILRNKPNYIKKSINKIEQKGSQKSKPKENANSDLNQSNSFKSIQKQKFEGHESLQVACDLDTNLISNTCESEQMKPKKNFRKMAAKNTYTKPHNNAVKSMKNNNEDIYAKKKYFKTDLSEKNRKLQKKKIHKKNCAELIDDFNVLDESLEKSIKCPGNKSIKNCNNSDVCNEIKNKKSSSSVKSNSKFLNYLSQNELKTLSNFGVLICGTIRINQKNYKEAYITAPDKGMDILIENVKDRNRALEGDEVYIVLKPKECYRTSADYPSVQRTAVVVAIKTQNHKREAIGVLNTIKNKENFALFSPRDMRLPRIRIKKNNWPEGFFRNSEMYKNKLYLAKISQWNDLRFAEGELLEELGLIGDIETETNAILLGYGLKIMPYSDTLKKCIPPALFKISPKEIQNREDFRHECVFTIDPATAVDLDDAVSCKQLENGNYEVGVHISDVSYYLKEGTPLDSAVMQRATSIYLVQKVYHMLPFELCRLCSLTPGEDKLSFSVIWEITPDCEIIKHRFARTVINSCVQLSYEQVQSIIKETSLGELPVPKVHGVHSMENIKNTILLLHKVAAHLRKKRFDSGALRISQKKIIFLLDEHNLPKEFKAEVHDESHFLIEEFMLLANVTVAQKLSEQFPDIAFLRSHAPPVPYVLKKLQKNLEKYNMQLDISSSGSIHAFLMNYYGNDIKSVAQMLVLRNLIAKPMTRANYYCSGVYPDDADRHHYALNVPLYTHFTSPIRRYADIMVHRLLTAFVTNSTSPKWSINQVQRIAEHCNKQKYAAKMASEMSTELYHSIYVELKGFVQCEAVVCDIKDKSFDCIVISTGTHQRVYFERINAEIEQKAENGVSKLIIRWPANEDHNEKTIQIIEMFSIVKIQLKKANNLKIEACLLKYD